MQQQQKKCHESIEQNGQNQRSQSECGNTQSKLDTQFNQAKEVQINKQLIYIPQNYQVQQSEHFHITNQIGGIQTQKPFHIPGQMVQNLHIANQMGGMCEQGPFYFTGSIEQNSFHITNQMGGIYDQGQFNIISQMTQNPIHITKDPFHIISQIGNVQDQEQSNPIDITNQMGLMYQQQSSSNAIQKKNFQLPCLQKIQQDKQPQQYQELKIVKRLVEELNQIIEGEGTQNFIQANKKRLNQIDYQPQCHIQVRESQQQFKINLEPQIQKIKTQIERIREIQPILKDNQKQYDMPDEQVQDQFWTKVSIQKSLKQILLLRAERQKILLEGIPLSIACKDKNKFLQEQIFVSQDALEIRISKTMWNDCGQKQFSTSKNVSLNKWVFLVFQPTIYLRNYLHQNEDAQIFTDFHIQKSEHLNIEIGIVQQSAKPQHLNSFSTNRIGLHLRNGQVFDNGLMSSSSKGLNRWRDSNETFTKPNSQNLVVRVKIGKHRQNGLFTVTWTLAPGTNQQWSQSTIVNQKIISQGLNFYTALFHRNDLISIKHQLQNQNLNYKRPRSDQPITKQIDVYQRPLQKKVYKGNQSQGQVQKIIDQTPTHKESKLQPERDDQKYKKELKKYQNILVQSIKSGNKLNQEDQLINKLYAKKQRKTIQSFIGPNLFINNLKQSSQKILNINFNIIEEPNQKMRDYLKVQLRENVSSSMNDVDTLLNFLYPQIAITKLNHDKSRNKWVFYILRSHIDFKSIKDGQKKLTATFYIEKSQHSNIQIGVVGKNAKSEFFNSLSNQRIGLHLRNLQVYDKLQDEKTNRWRNSNDSLSKPKGFDKIDKPLEVMVEISYNHLDKIYNMSWKIGDWSQASFIGQKLVEQGVNFFLGVFHTNDKIIANRRSNTGKTFLQLSQKQISAKTQMNRRLKAKNKMLKAKLIVHDSKNVNKIKTPRNIKVFLFIIKDFKQLNLDF